MSSADRRKKRYARSDIERRNKNRPDEYRVNPDHQHFLNDLNDSLSEVEARLTGNLHAPQRAVVFIVGVVRSGSSFLYQAIAGTHEFAYISNFSSRFWLAPHVGGLLEEVLGIRKTLSEPDFRSDYGTMSELQAPHEFQFFWDQWFAQGQLTQALSEKELAQIDVPALQRAIAGIEAVWQKPVLLKSLFWSAYQIGFLAKTFPRSLFVHIHRDPFFVAQSIAVARTRIRGSIHQWWGPRPPEYEELCRQGWADQIMGQVFYTGERVQDSLACLPASRSITLQYDDLCANPAGCLLQLQRRLADLNETTDLGKVEIPPSNPSKQQQLPDLEFAELRDAYERWFGGDGRD